MSGKVKFTDRIQPICVPRSCSEDCYTGDEAQVTGYGSRGLESEIAEQQLQKATVYMISDSMCQQGLTINNINRPLTDRMVCAGNSRTGEDGCRGDEGGPLTCKPQGSSYQVLTGVKSVVDACGKIGLYSTYTKPCSVYGWLSVMAGLNQAPPPPAPVPPGPNPPPTYAPTPAPTPPPPAPTTQRPAPTPAPGPIIITWPSNDLTTWEWDYPTTIDGFQTTWYDYPDPTGWMNGVTEWYYYTDDPEQDDNDRDIPIESSLKWLNHPSN